AETARSLFTSREGSSFTSAVASRVERPRLVASESTPVPTTIDRYVVRSVLGRGAMAVVYAASDPQLERQVAIKLLHPRHASSDRDGLEKRLHAEARAMARLSHPNVVTVHDVGRSEGRIFLAMELVDGKTLREHLADDRLLEGAERERHIID